MGLSPTGVWRRWGSGARSVGRGAAWARERLTGGPGSFSIYSNFVSFQNEVFYKIKIEAYMDSKNYRKPIIVIFEVCNFIFYKNIEGLPL